MFNNQGMNNGNGMAFVSNPIPQLISVRIDGNKIIQLGMQEQVIGYTSKAYDDAVALAEEYEKMLIEHGIIKKEKTAEEQMDDIAKKMDAILSSLNGINERVVALEEMTTKPESEVRQ